MSLGGVDGRDRSRTMGGTQLRMEGKPGDTTGPSLALYAADGGDGTPSASGDSDCATYG